MRPEANEIQMHEEDGVTMYSVARVERGGACGICHKDAPATAEISRTEIYCGGGRESRRWDVLYICEGCADRVGNLFAPHNAGKELFNGALQPAA